MKTKIPCDKKQRHLEFLRLFATVPGESRADKIRFVSEKLLVSTQTVRIYLMKSPPRVPPKLALRVLADEIHKAANR